MSEREGKCWEQIARKSLKLLNSKGIISITEVEEKKSVEGLLDLLQSKMEESQ